MFSILGDRLMALRSRYAKPHRFYHGQAHIDALLGAPAGQGGHIAYPAAAELAVWYHDAIYDPAAGDNEDRSAALLVAEMDGLACPSIVRAAEGMVRATAGHELPANLLEWLRGNTATFLDLDMAVLGANAGDYDAYETRIAAEYARVHGLSVYHSGRAAFLHGMLARKRLFHTERFHLCLDAPARTNLQRARQALAN
jgi:predicted metal-dependent HD superfamily phosphohydrolase